MRKKIFNFLDLKSDLDNVDEIHQSIISGISFRGTNLWILVFAIIIASVGLNTNSTAVIIGAMLISPLMGPINGMGYAIATYNFELFRRAIKNFAFAVAASLAASTLYFFITPISTAHSELLARTSPTIYDVLIALFGGMAGIVAISSKQKGNVIPGVAIATALMPPLCTAGYGIATNQISYFFGAFYLFTINTVFIGISSVLFSQFLNFPIRTLIDPLHKRQVNRWISFVITITIIPSIYFGYVLVEKEKFSKKAEQFITSVGAINGSYLLRYEVNPGAKDVKLIYGGNNLSNINKQEIRNKALNLGLDTSRITFEQGFSFESVNEDISEIGNNLKTEFNRLKAEVQQSEKRRDSVKQVGSIGKGLLQELKILFPEVQALSYAKGFEYSIDKALPSDSTQMARVTFTIDRNKLKSSDTQRIERWIRTRLSSDSTLRVLFIPK